MTDIVPLARAYFYGASADPAHEPSKEDGTVLFEAIAGAVDDINTRTTAITYIAATWTALAAITGATAAVGASVRDTDTGTHTDPVVGGTVANAGVYSWSTSPAGWKRIGANYMTAASNVEAIAGTATDRSMTPSADKAALDARLPGLVGLGVSRAGSVVALLDRTGRVAFDVDTAGDGWLKGRKIVLSPSVTASFEARQRMYIGFYGGSNSLNASDGASSPIDTYYPGFVLMPSSGLESLAGSSYGAAPATGTKGFTPGSTRERACVPVLRAMAYGPLAGSELVVDLAGWYGSSGQLDGLTSGTTAFANLTGNVATFAAEALTEGKTFGIGVMVFDGGEQDWRDAYTVSSYTAAFAAFDAAERAALAAVTHGNAYPRFVVQPASHAHWVSEANALAVTQALGAMDAIKDTFVAGPDYVAPYVDGATYGWDSAIFRSPSGHAIVGAMVAKAWARWAKTGTWTPLRMTSARLYDRRVIEVSLHVPVPPLRISATTVAETVDGKHGLEVWIAETRYPISAVEITDDGTASGTGRIVIDMGSALPAGTVEVWAARTSDTAGTASGDYYTGRQPGPDGGPRTTICDSDDVSTEPWAFRLRDASGVAFDLRNYLVIGKVIAS